MKNPAKQPGFFSPGLESPCMVELMGVAARTVVPSTVSDTQQTVDFQNWSLQSSRRLGKIWLILVEPVLIHRAILSLYG